jgi:hypothetical protein
MPRGIALLVVLAACAVGSTAAAVTPIPCELKLAYGSRSQGPPGQLHVDLTFVNQGPTSCRLSGFPDVELIGPVYPDYGSIYVLSRQAGGVQTVTLPPGGRAHAELTWLPSSGNGSWVPGYVRVVVPTGAGASFPLALPWRYGPVLRQDAATHPGTYVGPVRRGR